MSSHVNGCIPRETRAKFQRLEDEGFLGQTAPDCRDILTNDDVRKHFMFLFYHCLTYKEPGLMFRTRNERDEFVNSFRRLPGSAALFWKPIRVDRPNSLRGRPWTVEFRIRDLLVDFRDVELPDLNESRNLDDSGNLNINKLTNLNVEVLYQLHNVRRRRAPQYLGDTVQIDYLFRDNSITVELPDYLHSQKTMLIDNIIRVPTPEQTEGLIRQPGTYWHGRYGRGYA
ncbi:MAG: hypothetical protein NMK33_01240 [Candidatus Cardinium sp.]|uniref:hypothetical protein n=1 Tax=Cardinium endosymbiont of Dermatophagoides farinae TaxID=2597823 RepID=UPI0011837EE7|nr:hypothetical protein [Cardinium endosymbiont of Dermatophagoides farinae]UWW97176.1 MAG: hypothetical protein NMK33_01240 [Candidatus Cardinium sp.]